MKIRFATKSDIPVLVRLLRQVGEVHHRGRPDVFRENALKYRQSDLEVLLQDPDRPVFVAEQKQVVGYAFCIRQTVTGDPVLQNRRELYVDDLCVDENFRRQHVGAALYRAVTDYARREKFDAVTLNVWACNPGAVEFYRQMGLTPRKIGMELRLEDRCADQK